jgi:hypothetical protein
MKQPQRGTRRGEGGFEFIAPVRQHALQRPAGAPDGGPQDVAQKAGGGGGRQRRQDARDAVGGRGIAGGDLPDLPDPFELADVEGVQTDELARALGVRLVRRTRSGPQPA